MIRIAIHQTTEVGRRAAGILLGERDLTELGVVDAVPSTIDPRLRRVTRLDRHDVLVTDAAEPSELMGEAAQAGIHCVVWREVAADGFEASYLERDKSLVTGANLATGVAPALAAHEATRLGEVLDVTTAWTEPGRPLRRGEPVPFPDPVGAQWARARTTPNGRALVAPVDGEWAAALTRVTSAGPGGVTTRVVGVADLAPHLEAIALAAAALGAARGSYPPGTVAPTRAGEAYLRAALEAGLDVAAYTVEGVG